MTSQAWLDEGQRLISAKVKHPSTGPIANYGPWAYLSERIDIPVDGKYTLSWGVPQEFLLAPPQAQDVMSFAVEFPPDTPFKPRVISPFRLVNGASGNIVEVDVSVSDLRSSYTGFTAWLY